MLYYLPQFFLVQQQLLSKEKYKQIKKDLSIKESSSEPVNVHIDVKKETPKLIYSERYIEN
jgi:hypothetical protein